MQPRARSGYDPSRDAVPDTSGELRALDEPRRVRRWGLPRYEVAVPARRRAVVPAGRCCACGRTPRDGVAISDVWLHIPLVRPRGVSMPEYDFPLCATCASALGVRAGFLIFFGGIAFMAVVAYAVVAWMTRPPSSWLWSIVQVLVLSVVATSAGAGIGTLLARLAGLVHPFVRAGNQVADAVAYDTPSYRAVHDPADARLLFRFGNLAYARDFAAANAG